MQKIGDTIVPGTDSDVKENLKKIAIQIADVSNTIPVESDTDIVGAEAQRILRYVAKEVVSLSHCLRTDMGLFSWRTRNVFEALLILKHVIESRENATSFYAQRGEDEKTILEGILGFPSEAADTVRRPVLERAEEINAALLEIAAKDSSKYWRVPALAGRVGMKVEYDAFYKFYSKYAHPSSWIINAVDEDQQQHWEPLLLTAQLFANACLGEGQNFVKSRDVKTPR